MNRPWRALIATPSALGLRVFLLMTPVSVLGAAFAVPGSTPQEVLQRTALGVLAQCVVGVLMAIGWPIALRIRQSQVFVLVWVLVTYAIRGAVLAFAFAEVGAPDHISTTMRILGSMITMGTWTLLIASAVQARQDYHSQLERNLNRIRGLEGAAAAKGWSSESINSDFDSTRERVAQVLRSYSIVDISQWANLVRQAVEDDLRPFSHRLWQASARGATRRERFTQFVWRVAHEPVPLLPVVAVLLVLLTWNSLLRYGWVDGGITAVVYGSFLFATTTLLTYVRNRRLLDTPMQNVVELVAVTLVVPGFVIIASIIWSALPGEPIAVLGLTLYGLGATVVMLVIWATIEGARVAADRATEDADALDLLIQARADTRSQQFADAARYLHNSLQSRLLRMQVQASTGKSSPELDQQVAEANQLLAHLAFDRLPAKEGALEELVAAVDSWAGIIDVTLTVDRDFPDQHPVSPHITLFAQEAIANAIRHGGANVVVVHLTSQAGAPSATITDNGSWTAPGALAQGRHGPLSITMSKVKQETTVHAKISASWDTPTRASQ